MMDDLRQAIERARASNNPTVHFIRRARATGRRLGVFASSFNPVTRAHLELMRRAAGAFALDETLALAGTANADKSRYEASLKDRLNMLSLALEVEDQISIGLSSHAFFVDMIDALALVYGASKRLYFVLGFDTFARLLDPGDKYTALYYRKFRDRTEALEYLLARCRLVVAGRAGADHTHVQAALCQTPEAFRDRVLYLDFPADLGELSATQVRERLRDGLTIDALVAPSVERYIRENKLFRPAQ